MVLYSLVVLSLQTSFAYQVDESTYEAIDYARSGRHVIATLYMAKENNVPAPVVAFAHGFGLSATAYPLARELTVRLGMTVLLPHNLGVPSTLDLALDQIFLLAHAVKESKNATSLFHRRVSNQTVLAGHSLGGGSTLLAADSSLASAYPSPTAIMTVSLGTYTIPNSLLSAPRIPSQIPALLLTASEDCVDPPQKNSLPVFYNLKSECAFVVSVVGGSHCQFAARSWGCSITEKLCGARPNISREDQVEKALDVVIPFLSAALNRSSIGRWKSFGASLSHSLAAGNTSLLAHHSESCVSPSYSMEHRSYGKSDLDSGFAEACQRKVASITEGSGIQLSIEAFNVSFARFLTTKPSLRSDATGSHLIVTTLSHEEDAPPFGRSMAVKMKSAQSISPSAAPDNVSCASLNSYSLTVALSSLSKSEQQAYCNTTRCLQFGEDVLWHTGLWVPFAKLQIIERNEKLIVVSPRFYAGTAVPGDWGGVVYCRLLTPSAIRDWIRIQVAGGDGSSTLVI